MEFKRIVLHGRMPGGDFKIEYKLYVSVEKIEYAKVWRLMGKLKTES